MTDLEKLRFLRSKLGGVALEEISSLAMVEGNFSNALDRLEQRFSNPRKIVEETVILFLDQPGVSMDDGAAVLRLIQSLESTKFNLQCMASNGVSVEQAFMVIIALRKLEPSIRRRFEDYYKTINLHSSAGERNLPTQEQLLRFLKSEYAQCSAMTILI
jgi:hypothetical protein